MAAKLRKTKPKPPKLNARARMIKQRLDVSEAFLVMLLRRHEGASVVTSREELADTIGYRVTVVAKPDGLHVSAVKPEKNGEGE